ncbi:hypothetical protein CVT26_004330 [Gymnopilus dilepis]|uniref:Uncharacterized protein n=1 Tax=Gymnopilus dilepis TaxID=231916 RepID=A0A409YMP9_9AGAR|nr:hypothetical protein CVT26_004330 [Gymnopilus dilepis]
MWGVRRDSNAAGVTPKLTYSERAALQRGRRRARGPATTPARPYELGAGGEPGVTPTARNSLSQLGDKPRGGAVATAAATTATGHQTAE